MECHKGFERCLSDALKSDYMEVVSNIFYGSQLDGGKNFKCNISRNVYSHESNMIKPRTFLMDA